MAHAIAEVSRLTDAALVCRLERLVRADRALSAKLLVHLGELDERKLFRERGYSSCFDYCRSALRMSEAEAYLRIHAARMGRRFPLIVERLGAGAVHLSAVKLISPHLTEDNHVQLLDRVRGRTKREIEVLVAEMAPKPDVPARLRKLPDARRPAPELSNAALATAPAHNISMPTPQLAGDALETAPAHNISNELLDARIPMKAASAPQAAGPTPATAPVQEPPSASISTGGQPMAQTPSSSFVLQSPRARAAVTPLGLGRFRLELTLGQQARDQLDQLQELLRHQNPSGDLANILERALRELLVRTKKQRFAQSSAPARRSLRKPDVDAKTQDSAKEKSRYIPREVLRQVHARDAGQCTFVSPDGRRCTERGFLEVHHHHTTFARGGDATVDNLRLTCRTHNRFFAEQDYGSTWMRDKVREVAARSDDQLRL